MDKVVHFSVFNGLLYGSLDRVFVTGVCVDDIPFGAFCHYKTIPFPLMIVSRQC